MSINHSLYTFFYAISRQLWSWLRHCRNRYQFGYEISSIDWKISKEFYLVFNFSKNKKRTFFFPPFLPYPFKSGRVQIFWPFLGWAKIKARFKGQKSIQENCCIFNTRNEWSSSWKVPKSYFVWKWFWLTKYFLMSKGQ